MKKAFIVLCLAFIVIGIISGCANGSGGSVTKEYDYLYEVGVDVDPGIYLVREPDGGITGYCIANDPELNNIVSNGHFHNRHYIEVEEGEYFKIYGSEMIPFSAVKPYESSNGIIADGQFFVGFDVEPGTYRLIGTGPDNAGQYVISNDANCDDVVKKNTFIGNEYITVYKGDYIELSYCVME